MVTSSSIVTSSNASIAPLPKGWEQAVSDHGIPYFINHTTGKTSWMDPRADVKLKHEEYKHVRFNAYRVVMKLRHIQTHTHLREITFRNLLDALHNTLIAGRTDNLTVPEMQRALTVAFELGAVSEPKLCADRTVYWLLCVYDLARTGLVHVRDFKFATSNLTSGQLSDKLRYAFSLIDSDADGVVNRNQLELYIASMAKIIVEVAEVSEDLDTSPAGITRTVESCLKATQHLEDGRLPLLDFIYWALLDKSVVVFVPLLARMNFSEHVTHNARCKGCGMNPIVGLRYRCMKCFGYDLCQNCFFAGRQTGKHLANHPLLEYCYPEKNGFSVFKKRVKNIGKKWDWQLPASQDYISASSDIDFLIAREQAQIRDLASLVGKKNELDSPLNSVTAADDEETHYLIARLAEKLAGLSRDDEEETDTKAAPPAQAQPNTTIIHQHIVQQMPPAVAAPVVVAPAPAPAPAPPVQLYSVGVQAVELLNRSTQTEGDLVPEGKVRFNDELDDAQLYTSKRDSTVMGFAGPTPADGSADLLRSTNGLPLGAAALVGSAAPDSLFVASQVEDPDEVAGGEASRISVGHSIRRKATLHRQHTNNSLIAPADLELLAEQELLAASLDLETVVEQIGTTDENEEPGFGEQLLQAARAIAESTSLLVSQAASTRKGNVEWSSDVADKAKAMHEAAQSLAENIRVDAEGGHVSEEQLIASAKAVEAASDALLQVVDVDSLKITSPMAKEARNTLRKSRVQFDELVAFAEGEAEDEKEEGGRSVSISDDAKDDDGPLSGLRKVGGSFTQRLTLKRQSLQDKTLSNRWLRIMFAIEEEAGIDVPNVTEDNALVELPKRLQDGVLVCHLLRAFLPEDESLTPHEPALKTMKLPTIRIMENLEKFLEGCRKLGVPEKSMCTIYDIMEGRRPLKVVNCLETVIALGNQKKA